MLGAGQRAVDCDGLDHVEVRLVAAPVLNCNQVVQIGFVLLVVLGACDGRLLALLVCAVRAA